MTYFANDSEFDTLEKAQAYLARKTIEDVKDTKSKITDTLSIKFVTKNGNTYNFSPSYTYSEFTAKDSSGNKIIDYPGAVVKVADLLTGENTIINSSKLDSEINYKTKSIIDPEISSKVYVGRYDSDIFILDSEIPLDMTVYHQIKDDDSDYAKNIISIQNQIESLTTLAVSALEDVYDGTGDSDLVASLVNDLETIKTITREEVINNSETKLPYKAGVRKSEFTGYWAENVYFVNEEPAYTNVVQSFAVEQAMNTTYQYKGYFVVEESGYYKFSLRSDDAGYLWVGDVAITGFTLDNSVSKHPGLHGVNTGDSFDYPIYLEKGFTPFRAIQGNSGGPGDLTISVIKPNGTQINIEDIDTYGNMKYLKYKAVDF